MMNGLRMGNMLHTRAILNRRHRLHLRDGLNIRSMLHRNEGLHMRDVLHKSKGLRLMAMLHPRTVLHMRGMLRGRNEGLHMRAMLRMSDKTERSFGSICIYLCQRFGLRWIFLLGKNKGESEGAQVISEIYSYEKY
jgi:hypothetical protein